ncbi:hypothetical protein STEG23_024807 [Scotinomys teguina]
MASIAALASFPLGHHLPLVRRASRGELRQPPLAPCGCGCLQQVQCEAAVRREQQCPEAAVVAVAAAGTVGLVLPLQKGLEEPEEDYKGVEFRETQRGGGPAGTPAGPALLGEL